MSVSTCLAFHAVDDRTAFVFGALSVPAGTLRSVLLRTTDGGAIWQETLTPITGTEVYRVAFADRERGWAIGQWTVEGPSVPALYRSDNGGSSWTELTGILGPEGTNSYALDIKFSDPLNGEIRMAYWTYEGEPLDIAILASSNGGATWRTLRRTPASEIPDEMRPQRMNASGRDGIVWELDVGALRDSQIVIRRGQPPDWTFA